MADNTNPGAFTQTDPIDTYLATLAQVKSSMDENLPRLKNGIDEILGGSMGSMIPNGIPMNNAIANANNANIGIRSFAPNTQNNIQPNGTQDYVNNLLLAATSPNAIAPSPAVDRATPIGYADGVDKLNFDRYYNHNQFKKLGWNPYLDNEAIYNANSSWTDDFGRASSQWLSLAGLGFSQTLNNWDDLFTLNTEGDTKSAREMEKMMSIANSTRGGLGGFVVNQYANSAYTVGVMGEMVAEELALFAATALTEGVLAAPAVAKTISNIGRFGSKLFGGINKAEDAARMTKTVSEAAQGVNTAVNSVQNVSQARKFWNGVGNFINPFSETAEAIKNMKTGVNGYDKLTDFARNAKTFGAFFRDMRLINTTLAESRLEGGFVENDTYSKLLSAHYDKHGSAPDEETKKAMMLEAKKAGTKTVYANLPVILYSNKIVFDKLLGGFKPFRNAGKGSLGTMVTSTVGKGAKKKTLYEGFIDTARPRDWFTKKNVKRIGQQFLPKNLAKNGYRYLSANLAEGFQEVYQEATAEVMTNYYVEKFMNPERAGSSLWLKSIEEGIDSQMSSRGLETFLSGFLMGGVVQGPQTIAMQTIPQLFQDIRSKRKDPVAYQEAKTEREAARKRVTDFMNQVASDPNKVYDPIYENLANQKNFNDIMYEAEQNGDKKTHKDAEDASLFSQVSNLINKGYIDLFTNQIESFESMTDEELVQAFGYTNEKGSADEYNKSLREKLTGIKDKVEQIKKRHEQYSSVQNPFNPESDDILEKMDWFGFEEVRKLAIYNEYTYDRAKSRMAGILNNAVAAGVGGAQAGRVTTIFNGEQIEREVKTLEDEIAIYREGDENQKKLAEEKQKDLDALNKVKNSILERKQIINDVNKSHANPEKKNQVQETAKLFDKVEVGAPVTYKPKSGAQITGKVVKVKGTKVTIEYTNAKGETLTKEVSINAKSLKLVEQEKAQLEIPFDENAGAKAIEYWTKELEQDIRQYLSRVTGLPENSTQLDKLVIDMMDYYELEQDAQDASDIVNKLNDPQYFFESSKKFSAAARAAQEIAARKMQEAFDEYMHKAQINDLLKQLYVRFRVFFPPEEIESLLKGERIPSVFFNADTKEVIDVTSSKYGAIIDYLEEFEQDNGYTLKGKPILGQDYSAISNIDDYTTSGKGASYKQLMTDLGLDPNQIEQQVDVATLLNYIVRSKQDRPAIRKLAQRLANVLKDEKVTVSTKADKAYSYSKDKGVVIDLRYAASDFQDYRLTLGFLIINPLLQKIVQDNLSDKKFATAIQNVMDDFTLQYQAEEKKAADDVKLMYKKMSASPEAFVAEALTNPFAQQLLQVPYKNTNKNLWEEVLDSILSFISKFLGFKGKTDTALEEVLGIISQKLEGGPIRTTETSVVDLTDAKKAVKRVTLETPVSEMDPELLRNLRAAFAQTNMNLINKGMPALKDEQFAEWITKNPIAFDIINEYNIQNGLEPLQKAEEAPVVSTAKYTLENLKGRVREALAEAGSVEDLELIRTTVTEDFLAEEGLTLDEFFELYDNRTAELQVESGIFEEEQEKEMKIEPEDKETSNESVDNVNLADKIDAAFDKGYTDTVDPIDDLLDNICK